MQTSNRTEYENQVKKRPHVQLDIVIVYLTYSSPLPWLYTT
jgi:hypothetical protein